MRATKGKWRHERCHRSGFTIFGGKAFSVTVVDSVDDSGKHGAIKNESDARLMAAAPEMLEALIACDEAMGYMSEYDIPLMLPEQVKNAIDKARGTCGNKRE